MVKTYQETAYHMDKSNWSIPSPFHRRLLAGPITETVHLPEREDGID